MQHQGSRLALAARLGALLATLWSGAAPAADGPARPGLEGIDWQLMQYRAGDALRDAAPGTRGAVLRFDAGRLSGSAGCNRLMGAYSADAGRLSFEPHTASTMMACPPPLMAQEQAVVGSFEQATGYRMDAGRLLIVDEADQVLLVLAELQAKPLTGTPWRLTQYNNGSGGIVSVLSDTEVMLQLRADGHFAGKACNAYRGRFEYGDGRLEIIGPIAATRMACPAPEGAGEQENAFFAALERAAGYRISGDALTLTDAEGVTLAKFRAADD